MSHEKSAKLQKQQNTGTRDKNLLSKKENAYLSFKNTYKVLRGIIK